MVNKVLFRRSRETRRKNTFSELEIHMYILTIRTRICGKLYIRYECSCMLEEYSWGRRRKAIAPP
jgi:hypothetical protein